MRHAAEHHVESIELLDEESCELDQLAASMTTPLSIGFAGTAGANRPLGRVSARARRSRCHPDNVASPSSGEIFAAFAIAADLRISDPFVLALSLRILSSSFAPDRSSPRLTVSFSADRSRDALDTSHGLCRRCLRAG